MPFLDSAENRETFFARIGRFVPFLDPRYQAIEQSYDIAKEAFRKMFRASGERYFEHLRAVALIIIEYCEIEDHEIIIAALLHDIVEDCHEWTIERIQNEFGKRVALFVAFLTQPQVNGSRSLEEAESCYHRRLKNAPREVILIKLADRLHNLLTLSARPIENQKKKIDETIHHYLDLAREHQLFLAELRTVIRLLQKST